MLLVSFTVLFVFAQAPPSHGDFSEDYLAARDCVEGIRCDSRGTHASISGYDHGALWTWTLVGFRSTGLGFEALQTLVLFALALGCAAVFVMARGLMESPRAALASGAYLLSIVAFVHYDVLWNVALFPPLCVVALVAMAATTRRGDARSAFWAGAALAGAANCHLIAFAFFPLLLALIAWSARRAALSLLAATAGVAVVSLGLSWHAMVDNAVVLAAGSGAVVGLASIVAAIGVGLLVRTRRPRRSVRRPEWLVVGAFIVAVLVVAFALRLLLGRGPEVRFVSAGFPALAIGFIGLATRWRRWPIAAMLALAFVLQGAVQFSANEGPMGRRLHGTAWSLLDAERVAGAVYGAAYGNDKSYPELLRALDGPRSWHLLGSLACLEPEGRKRGTTQAPPRERLAVIKLPRSEAEELEFPLLALDDGNAAILLRGRSWLLREEMRVCCQPMEERGRPRECVSVGPDAWAVDSSAGFNHHDRDRPSLRLPELSCRKGSYRLDYEIPIAIPLDAPPRELMVFDIDKASRWRISWVDGLDVPEPLPSQRVTLGGAAYGPVVVRLSKQFGDPRVDDKAFPPSLLELAQTEENSRLLELVRKHYSP